MMSNRTSEEILHDIETRDRQSRIVGWTLVSIIIGTLAWLVIATNQINDNLSKQIAADNKQAVANQEATHKTLDAIKAQSTVQSAELRCIAELFISPKARAGLLRITDFDKCAVNELPASVTPNAATPPSTTNPAPVTSAPTNSTQSQSVNASRSNSNPGSPKNPTPAQMAKKAYDNFRNSITSALHSIGL